MVGEDATATLKCTAVGTEENVVPVFIWTYVPSGSEEPQMVTEDDGYELEGDSLTITGVSVSDSGNYSCTARHLLVAEHPMATVELIVQCECARNTTVSFPYCEGQSHSQTVMDSLIPRL